MWLTPLISGWGVKQDFKKAYELFERGVSSKCKECLYDQGYMLYKGLGVEQNYKKAILFFRKGISQGSLGSMYFLGLCFRNGYGIEENTDSARYWLAIASSKGFKFATDELHVPMPEVIYDNIENKSTSSDITFKKSAAISENRLKPQRSFQLVTNTAILSDMNGLYEGYIIRYDFSGKHIIGNTLLKLNLSSTGNSISGTWQEGNNPAIKLNAKMSDSGIIFTNTSYLATDHYSAGKLMNNIFNDARLFVVKKSDTVFIAGNLQIWSATRNEPGKPIYISLTRKSNLSNDSLVQNNNNLKTPFIKEFKVFPNPFKNSFQVCFYLNKRSNVRITIIDISGRIAFEEYHKFLNVGNYNLNILPKLIKGTYILSLQSDELNESTVIIKQ